MKRKIIFCFSVPLSYFSLCPILGFSFSLSLETFMQTYANLHIHTTPHFFILFCAEFQKIALDFLLWVKDVTETSTYGGCLERSSDDQQEHHHHQFRVDYEFQRALSLQLREALLGDLGGLLFVCYFFSLYSFSF